MDDVQAKAAKANKLYTVYHAVRRGYELGRVSYENVENACANYEQAQRDHQLARRNAGLPHLLVFTLENSE